MKQARNPRRIHGLTVTVPWCTLLYALLVLLHLPIPATCFSTKTPNGGSSSSTETKQLNINFVTGNQMKVKEVERILAEHGVTKNPVDPGQSLIKLNILNVDLPELQEVDTIAIAKDKVLLAAQLAGGPTIIEDTSLQFHALGGMPGPVSAAG